MANLALNRSGIYLNDGQPHASLDSDWGPYEGATLELALAAAKTATRGARTLGKKFGIIVNNNGVRTITEYMWTGTEENNYAKLVLSEDDVVGTFKYILGTTTSEDISNAIGNNKIITIENYIISVERVGTSSSAYYVLSYVDKDGFLHEITHGTGINSTGDEVKKKLVDVSTLTASNETMRTYVNNINVEISNGEFIFKKSDGTPIFKITKSVNGNNTYLSFVELTSGDDEDISAAIPIIGFNSQTKMLQYNNGSGWQNIIKVSNLQIKGVLQSLDDFTYPPYNFTKVDNTHYTEIPTQDAPPTLAIGDLFLVGDSQSGFYLYVCSSSEIGSVNYDFTYGFSEIGSINDVSLVAEQVGFDNSKNGFSANNVQKAIEEVASSLEGINKDYSLTEDDDSIEIEDEQGNKVVEITPNGVDAKNLKSNGKNVATKDELDLLATKEEVEGKQDEIEDIEQTEEAIQTSKIEFRDDENGYVGDISSQGVAAKKFLIKQNPNDEGVDIASVVSGVSIAKQLGLSDIIHVIGYGQSLMAGSSSGTPVTTTQNRSNLFRFAGGVRPYDVFDLDTNKRVAIKRQNGVNPSYLEMSDNKANCLEQSDITKINTSIGSLIPLTEQRINYAKNQDDTYSPTNSGGTFDARHGDGETPLSGFCEGLLNSLETLYGNNFGFDIIATCCAYGSADFPSLLPFDREGRTHNPSISDGSNMNYFEVLLMSVKGAKAIADAQNKSYSVDVVVYMESATQTPNISGVTVTNAMRAYRIAQLFTLINQRVKAITKQSNDILFLCDQSKTYDTQREALRILAVDKKISLTQAEKSALDTLSGCYIEPYDMSKIYLVTSANNYPIRKGYNPNDTGGDRIHHPSQVQKQKGATIGNAYADILTGKGFSPLSPIGIQVIGNDIYIKYHVPVSPVVIDTDAINGYQNHPTYMNGYGKYGFGISNGADNPTYYDIIDTVEVVESDTIKISCTDSLSGKTLEYCYRSMANNEEGTTGPTNSEFGNIRDSQGDVKKITINNNDYPLHNWCIGFSKQL